MIRPWWPIAPRESKIPKGAQFVIDTFRGMRKELAPQQGQVRKTWLQAILIGDIAIVGVPGEFFTVLGQEIKRRSPFRFTYVFELANDYIGYIPDRHAFELGGYQVWTGLHSFLGAGDRRGDRRRVDQASRSASCRWRRPTHGDRRREATAVSVVCIALPGPSPHIKKLIHVAAKSELSSMYSSEPGQAKRSKLSTTSGFR